MRTLVSVLERASNRFIVTFPLAQFLHKGFQDFSRDLAKHIFR